MRRYIDPDNIKFTGPVAYDNENNAYVRLSDVKQLITQTPSSDVVKVRHGKWKVVYRNKIATVYECSECGHLTFGTSNYCICGAKMDGKDGE